MAIPERALLEGGEELWDDSRRAQISERAHQLWVERGCPENSAEGDWLKAERLIEDAERQIEDQEPYGRSWSHTRW